jgi:hypothetical protein
VFDLVENDPSLVFSYYERAWMGWHDVASIKKAGIRGVFDTYKDQPY